MITSMPPTATPASGAAVPKAAYEICGVEFGTFDEAHKQRIKAVTITESAVYDRSGEPHIHGVMSRYMGTSGRFFCRTCHNTADRCGGHHGLIEFARPVYQPTWFHKPLIKALSTMCFFCSRLLVDVDKLPPSALNRRRKARAYNEVAKLCRKKCKSRVCANPACGARVQPMYKRAGQNIAAHWPEGHVFESEEERAFCEAPFTATDAREIFLKADPTVVAKYLHMRGNIADIYTPISMLVLPPALHPSVVVKNARQEDNCTKQLADIVRYNELLKVQDASVETLREKLRVAVEEAAGSGTAESPTPTPKRKRGRPLAPAPDPVAELGADLKVAQSNADDTYQRLVQAYNIHSTSDRSDGTETTFRRRRTNHVNKAQSLRDMIKSKRGLLRRNLLSCRINNSARCVIAPDPLLDVDQIRVPFSIAKTLSVPARASAFNIDFLKGCVRRGEDADWGARYVEVRPDVFVSLRGLSPSEREAVADKVELGTSVVHRCLHTGDTAFFNRQPTLHKYGMISVKCIVDRKDDPPNYTFRISHALCGPSGGDFDGDEANLDVPQDPAARAESHALGRPSANMMNGAKCVPTYSLLQDIVIGTALLTEATRTLHPEVYCDLVCTIQKPCRPIRLLDSSGTMSGRAAVEHLFPPTLQYNENGVHIRDGAFLPHSAPLSKKHLSSSPKSILVTLVKDFGPEVAQQFLSDMSRVAVRFLMSSRLVSMGIRDVTVDQPTRRAFEVKERSARKRYADAATPLEQMMAMAPLAKVSRTLMDTSSSHQREFNGLREFIDTGARGSGRNAAQINLCVGAQVIVDERLPRGMDGRTLACFSKDDCRPEADGWVAQSFREGMDPAATFIACCAGRSGVATTFCETADIGYSFRRLYRLLNSVAVRYDGTVRTGEGRVVLLNYFDGLSPEFQTHVHTNGKLFRAPPAEETHPETEALRRKLAAARVAASPLRPDDGLWVPVSWDRLIRGHRHQHDWATEAPVEWSHVVAFLEELGRMRSYQLMQLQFHVAQTVEAHPHMPKVLFDKLAEATRRQIPKCTAWAGTPAGSGAAELCEAATQDTLSTFHTAGEANETTKDKVRKLILLAKKRNHTFTVHVQLSGDASRSEKQTETKANDLVARNFGELLHFQRRVPAYENWKSLPGVARVLRRRPAAEPAKVMEGRALWELHLHPSAVREAQVTLPELVHAMHGVLPEGTLVWGTSLRTPAPRLFVAMAKGAADLDMASLRLTHVAGHPDVLSAECVAMPLPLSPDGEARFAVRARARSVRAVLTDGQLDAASLHVDCPLTAASLFGIEAAEALLADRLKEAIGGGGGGRVHMSHLRLVAAFLCMTGTIAKLDRFDVWKYSDDVLGMAAFETPMAVLQRAATHGEATEDVSHSVNSATILNVPPRIGSGIMDVVVRKDARRSKLSAKCGLTDGPAAPSARTIAAAAREADRRAVAAAEGNGPPPLPRAKHKPVKPAQAPAYSRVHQRFAWDMSMDVPSHLAEFASFARSHFRRVLVRRKKTLPLVGSTIRTRNLRARNTRNTHNTMSRACFFQTQEEFSQAQAEEEEAADTECGGAQEDAHKAPEAVPPPFTSVVLSGGGTSGIAFVGALEALAEGGSVDWLSPRTTRETTHYYGCSVGALFALLMYVGVDFRTAEQQAILRRFLKFFRPDMKSMFQPCAIGGASLCGDGRVVRKFLDHLIFRATGVKHATFHDLHKHMGGRGRLAVFVTSLERGALCLSHETHRYTRVSRAVFASLLIPFLFAPIVVRQPRFDLPEFRIDVDHCVDGSVGGSNYPIHAPSAEERALGVRFKQQARFSEANSRRMGFAAYAARLVSLAITNKASKENKEVDEVVIDTGGNNPVNFMLDEEQENKLRARGRAAAEEFHLCHGNPDGSVLR